MAILLIALSAQLGFSIIILMELIPWLLSAEIKPPALARYYAALGGILMLILAVIGYLALMGIT